MVRKMVNCRKEIFTGGVYEKEEIHWAFGGDLSSASWIIQQYKRFAAVTEGKAGETLTGEYAVIVNTDPEVAHNTGTLVFDDGADGTAPYTAGSVGASNSLGSVNVAGGSTNSAIALQSATTYTIGQEKYMGTTYSQKTYVCIGIGEHCYIWMEKT